MFTSLLIEEMVATVNVLNHFSSRNLYSEYLPNVVVFSDILKTNHQINLLIKIILDR